MKQLIIMLGILMPMLAWTSPQASKMGTKSESKKTMIYPAGNYKIDSDHSRVEFLVTHLMISEVQGRFNEVSGSFLFSEKIANSKVEATIQTASVDTGVVKRDADLKSDNFLDVKKYPTMVFKSKRIQGNSLDNFLIVGDLTIKGVTKEVILKAKFTGATKDPWGNQRMAFLAETKINRQDFNLKYNQMVEIGPVVGNIVSITIRTEGIWVSTENTTEPMKQVKSGI